MLGGILLLGAKTILTNKNTRQLILTIEVTLFNCSTLSMQTRIKHMHTYQSLFVTFTCIDNYI